MTMFIRPHRLLYFLIAVSFLFHACQDDPINPDNGDGSGTEEIKTKVFITAIQINDYPGTDPSGNSWDPVDSTVFDYFGLPDIFFNLSESGTTDPVFWSQNSHFSNIPPAQATPYYLTEPYQVVPVGSNFSLNVYDFELTDSTLMGSVNLFIGESPVAPKYPTEIQIVENGISVSVGLRWED